MIDRGGQALSIFVKVMAPMRAYSILEKWPKIAQMTPNDLYPLKIVFAEPQRNT